MRYKYTITKEGGETEEMEAMSWKKLFKKLLMKYPDFTGWVSYFNKKGHQQVRSFTRKKETTYGESEYEYKKPVHEPKGN